MDYVPELFVGDNFLFNKELPANKLPPISSVSGNRRQLKS